MPDNQIQPEWQQTQTATPQVDLDSILTFINNEDKISDLHVCGWEYITFRYNWDILKQPNYWKLSNEAINHVVLTSMSWDKELFEKFLKTKDEDYSYLSKEWIPYRVNAFQRLWKLALVMRKINWKALDLNLLMYPEVVQSIKDHILSRKKGLYLVTWPTGSWKSTSLVAMIEFLNQTRKEHIITMEDPVEFIYEPAGCMISQRNVWVDTLAFAKAIKGAMREDPDIILIWEIRDKETADAALEMAETWHLVFATLHTPSAAATVNRYISFFPPEIQASVGDRLSDALAGVQSQMLVKDINGWRVWVYELMINTTAIRNNIKKMQIPQLNNTIDTWTSEWMITMKAYAERLINEWKVTQEAVQFIFEESS